MRAQPGSIANGPVAGDCQSYCDAARAPTGWIARLRHALVTRRQRRALMALDDRMLADIGLSRSQAFREANRPFLDVPPHGPLV